MWWRSSCDGLCQRRRDDIGALPLASRDLRHGVAVLSNERLGRLVPLSPEFPTGFVDQVQVTDDGKIEPSTEGAISEVEIVVMPAGEGFGIESNLFGDRSAAREKDAIECLHSADVSR